MNSFLKRTLYTLIVLLASCGTEPQDPTALFVNGEMPKKLQNLANQLGELKLLQADIVQQAEADLARDDLVTVAVIDNGVDLAHPDLYKKWSVDLMDGELAGIGFDVLGNDNWASSNLVRAHIFALGAKNITEDAKIDGSTDDPLSDLQKINAAFRAHLFTVLKASSALRGTPFVDNVVSSRISMSDVYDILKGAQGDRASIRESMKRETLLDIKKPWAKVLEDMHRRELEKPESERQTKMEFNLNAASVARYYNGRASWFSGATGLEQILESGGLSVTRSFTQSADFLDSLEEAWKTFSGKEEFFRLVRPYGLFKDARRSKKAYYDAKKVWDGFNQNAVPDEISPDLADDLNELVKLKEEGLKALDPRAAFQKTVGSFLQSWINIKWAIDPKTPLPELAPQNLVDQMSMLSGLFEESLAFLRARPDMTDEELISVQKTAKKLKAVQAIMGYLAKDFAEKPDVSGGLRKELFQESLPYLSGESASVSHGSHVSGIVLKQDERLRVYPVRVATSKIQTSKDESEKLEDEFRTDFAKWLSNPVVSRAMLLRFPQLEQQAGMKNPEDYPALLSYLNRQFDSLIETNFNASFELDYRFIKDLHHAIRRVGERGIKIASASLGTGFKAPPAEGHFQDGRLEWNKVLEFLFFECMKSKTAQIIQDNAPDTLFVIATGNDGAWKDGYSQSALPVDLSSPFLKKAERSGETMPNNHLKNVVGVGSLNPEGQLSGFTNLLINSPTPMVMAEGENILSPIKKSDNEAVSNLLSPYELNQALTSLVDGLELLAQDTAKKAGKTPKEAKSNESNAMMQMMMTSMEMGEMMGVLSRVLISRVGNARARLSGTSMATPAVSGMLGKLIADKAERLGLSTTELYKHPQFSPQQLIQDLIATAQTSEGQFPVIKLMDQKKWEPSSEEKALVKLIEEWLKDTDMKLVDPARISRQDDSTRPPLAANNCSAPLI